MRVIIFIIHIVTVVTVISVLHAVHTFVAHSTIVITSKARAATSATPGTFVVSGQGIPARNAYTALIADMWSFACVEFGVAFEIVQPSKT